MLESVEWGEFRIEDIFDSFNGDFDIKKEHVNGLGNYVITAGMSNNGILGKTDVEAKIFPKNTITVDMFGTAFYRDFPYKMVTHARVFCLKANIEINAKQGLFLSSSLHFLSRFFGYENMCSWAKIKNKKIQLPIKNSQLALDFMENFVAELEARRSAELEAYLSAAGLKDYTLTAEEQQALAQLAQQQWHEFNLHNLFGKATRGKRLKSTDRVAGNLPFVTAGEADTGISAFIGNDVERFKANTVTIDMFGSAKYRNYEYGGDDHIAVVHTDNLHPMAALFITSSIHKASYNGQFNYGRNFYAKDADALNILLPEKNGLPDYAYMQTLLSAVQKLVIKDVVQYADNKIAATQSVIWRNNQTKHQVDEAV
ncbi:restriction endonuclease subunit S [Neisseria weaveri]|uniref:restriction endonuclease subunit S n=1 Tax=Neisseria weaveri TaxID=28091 RepID=UPI000D30EDD0|nr:restriction endonuclease subunit S [Neisseria weaveri]